MTKYQKFTEFIKENHRFTLKDVMQYLMASDVYCRQIINKGISNNIVKLYSKGVWETVGSEVKPEHKEETIPVSERFGYLRELVGMVAKRVQPALLLMGTSGVGKSHLVIDTLNTFGLIENQDYHIFKGHTTPFGLFETLHNNRDSIIIYDDCDAALQNPLSASILKASLDSYNKRTITWISSRMPGALEQSFDFDGQVIFISNMHPYKVDEAIKSRSFCYNLHLNPDEMHDYMTEILPKIYPTVPIEQKQEVLNYLHKYRNMWKNYNLRSLIQAIRIRVGVSNGIDWKKMAAVLSRGSM